jgi:hypothetical protein
VIVMRLPLLAALLASTLALAEGPQASATATADEPKPPTPALRVGLGYRTFTRSFSSDSTNLGAYNGALSSGVAVDALWFPGAHVTTGTPANVGVLLQADFGMGVQTSTSNGSTLYGVKAERLTGAVAVRLPMGRVELDVFAGYHALGFNVDAAAENGTKRPALPGITLHGPHVGLGLQVALVKNLALDLGVGGTYALGFGELQTAAFYPNATGGAIDANVGLHLAFADALQLKLTADLERALLNLNILPGAPYNGTAAADQWFGATLSLAWAL